MFLFFILSIQVQPQEFTSGVQVLLKTCCLTIQNKTWQNEYTTESRIQWHVQEFKICGKILYKMTMNTNRLSSTSLTLLFQSLWFQLRVGICAFGHFQVTIFWQRARWINNSVDHLLYYPLLWKCVCVKWHQMLGQRGVCVCAFCSTFQSEVLQLTQCSKTSHASSLCECVRVCVFKQSRPGQLA